MLMAAISDPIRVMRSLLVLAAAYSVDDSVYPFGLARTMRLREILRLRGMPLPPEPARRLQECRKARSEAPSTTQGDGTWQANSY